MNDATKDLEATIAYRDGDQLSPDAAEVGQAPVGVISGKGPRFADETAALLHTRLKAASLILAIISGLVLIRILTLFVHEPFVVVVRAATLLVMIASYVVLRKQITLSLPQLRLIELAVFGGLIVQMGLTEWLALNQFAAAGEFATVVGVKNLLMAVFSISILIYGMLMPNTWWRATAILFPVAAIPYAIIFASQIGSENVTQALQADQFGTLVPLPFFAACAAVYGTHVINSIRREAFKARQFGQYRLKEKLGVGGMGEVYRAEHILLKRPCVIKLIKEDQNTDAAALARFEREVQSTAKLTHWNSVEIFDYGHTDDGVFYYVMEYLPGKSLDDLVKQHGPLPPERAVHFLRQTCRALREAHHLGLVHRDLKPANIFAAKLGGDYDVAKLLDFGLVRQAIAGQQEGINLTQEGSFSGSPLYMPPEQVAAYGDVDGRADIYSLGATAYFILTGRPPFSGRSATEVIMAHATQPVTPPSEVVSAVPSDLERVIVRCLEKKPEDRFQDVQRLEEALAACECADKWTDKMAAQWWRDAGASLA